MRILVTGSSGYLASYVMPLLKEQGHQVIPFDLPYHDVRDHDDLLSTAQGFSAEFCIHLAGLKYADRAETNPLATVDVNVHGTANVTRVFGSDVILASTCKAADPETVYGSSKLIAERITLVAGGRVVRLVNVLGSVGSVTEIWDAVPEDQPLPVCDATRIFMTSDQAARLFLGALEWKSGRYAKEHAYAVPMTQVARDLYPTRAQVNVPRRRGDREHERLLAACEYSVPWVPGVVRIIGMHDPAAELTGAHRDHRNRSGDVVSGHGDKVHHRSGG